MSLKHESVHNDALVSWSRRFDGSQSSWRSNMVANSKPLVEPGHQPEMTSTRVMIRGGGSLVRKLVLGGRLGAALLMLVAFGVLALPLSFFSDEGELLLRRTPKRRLQYTEPQA